MRGSQDGDQRFRVLVADDVKVIARSITWALEEAGYIECNKSFDGRTPRTEFGLTPTGRRELEAYLDHMEAIIRATRDEAPR